ncbi:MAG TPA: FAD-binding and (Fe-S)-binding domain-containing protein [Thermoanaerobaculia bacterium]|nr:FAD-binding and (Fe-S)-binding domain-containing protein [Thermoanaerobaculia bacterium]
MTTLETELRAHVRGEVRFDAGSRALYATDASNYRQVPIGIVIPRTIDDVTATVEVCRGFGAPVLSRGGGTSLAGQCCNVAVVLDFSKHLNRILDLDPQARRARIEPGLVLDELRDAAEQHHLTFGPDPATHTHCTLGGMIGNNSCGVHSVMAGKTDANVEELEVLTYDGLRLRVGATKEEELERIVRSGGRRGEIYARLRALRDRHAGLIREKYPDIPRRVSGYNLNSLLPENGFHVARALVGSEGTCVTVLEATLRLVPSPPARTLLVLGYPDVYTAADHVPEILEHGPTGLEGIDEVLVGQLKRKHLHMDGVELLPEGRGWLLVEMGGEDREESDSRARDLMAALRDKPDAPAMVLFDDPRQAKALWKVRESALGATAHVPGEPHAWEGWEDSAVAPAKLGGYLRELRKLMDRYGYGCSLYGHFGDGCVHTRIDFDLVTEPGIRKLRAFVEDAADLVLRYGGSLSGEHGDGQSRAELLPRMFGPELVDAFREFKSIWDPDGRMNPGKVVDAYRLDQNLRLGTGYNPPRLRTHFRLPDDDGSLANATLRCVGVGACRKTGSGTMCPSYMATREELHSTRGRARLLFEMLEGDPLSGGWRDEHVKEALDLCLACKACKGECPVEVDMATYKAEFFSHYYALRLRPRPAYAFGLIRWWARLASNAPHLANLVTQTPGLRSLAKLAAGIAPERSIPAFAPSTFRKRFAARKAGNGNGRRVLLWPDTFNDHFHPEIPEAAVEVLERLGFGVEIPRHPLCCGRPLYDYGMLRLAKRRLREILTELRDEIRAGTPIVALEPSCAAVFRDELVNLFPDDEDARRLSQQVFLLSELLVKEKALDRLPELRRRAVLHVHCHQKALVPRDGEKEVLEALGLDLEILDSGCCGMAGAFGFEEGEHYRVSMQCGERVLLPAVRKAQEDTLVLADGFSCHEQITQGTGRRPLHLAQVLRMAYEGTGSPPGERRGEGIPWVEMAAAGGLGFLVGKLAGSVLRRRRSR